MIQTEKWNVWKNERDLLEQADNVATLGEYFAQLQRCDECIERLKERSRVKVVLGCLLEIDNLWWSGSRGSRVQRFDCKDVLYILAVIIQVLTAVTRRDSFDERSIPRSKIVYWPVINALYRIATSFGRRRLYNVRTSVKRYRETQRCKGEHCVQRWICDVLMKASIRENMNSSEYRICVSSTSATSSNPRWRPSKSFKNVTALSRILDLTVNVNKYNPMCAGCYVKAMFNVQSTDNVCFAWSVVAALYPEQNVNRTKSYTLYVGIAFPGYTVSND